VYGTGKRKWRADAVGHLPSLMIRLNVRVIPRENTLHTGCFTFDRTDTEKYEEMEHEKRTDSGRKN
jgi:hypothetical protein